MATELITKVSDIIENKTDEVPTSKAVLDFLHSQEFVNIVASIVEQIIIDMNTEQPPE